MRDIKAKSTLRSRGAVAILAGMAYMLSGCVGDEDTSAGNPAAMTINTPAQIAQVSADDYNSNVNGLITGATLQHWIDDWENNKPAGINGRLIILQVSTGTAGKEYITPKPTEGVLTYRLDTDRQTQVRSNGVIETIQMVPDGNQMDDLLSDYNIDPNNDMIVCAMGTGHAGTTMAQGRCWYMFRYWGTPKTNLALLNGLAVNASVMNQDYLGSAATCDESLIGKEIDEADPSLGVHPDCLPRNGRVSVRDLPEDNLSLMATVDDVIAVAEGRSNDFVWDARSENEYTAKQGVSGSKYLGIDFRGTPGGSAPRQGHPLGAVVLPYSNLQMTDGSLRYKSKAEIAAIVFGNDDTVGFKKLVPGTTDLVDAPAYQSGQTVITYCETTFRAMITGFASAAILGLPNRFYDGAMVEWNSLTAGVQDKFGSFPMPADSPWRTDLASRSHFAYNTPEAIGAITLQDPYAARSSAVTVADRAYRLGASDTSSGGGSVAPPTNPCGG